MKKLSGTTLGALAISSIVSGLSLVPSAQAEAVSRAGFRSLGNGTEVRTQIFSDLGGKVYAAGHEKETPEGKCGEGKCGEGDGSKKGDKSAEGKCGEGKCGE